MAWLPQIARILVFDLPLAAAIGACLYQAAVAWAALRFHFEKADGAEFTPPVSLLKPLRGIEPNLYASLRTFFEQDYPGFEIVFGLTDPKDPASWTIAQLRREFPEVPVKLVVVSQSSAALPAGANPPATNPKMNKLQRMVEQASFDLLVWSDADIRVEPDYLRNVVRPLRDQRVGLVTCLYRGVPRGTLISRLEALGMSAEFAGQVLLAGWLQGVRFGLGATIATRKQQIAEIGGLAPWADYLADDYILGNRIAAAGYSVQVSHTVVETLLPVRTLAETFQQLLRWARTIRACSPRGYFGLLFGFGVPLALLPLLYHFTGWTAAVLLAALATRWLAAWAAGVVICQDPAVRKNFWLIPLRDALALGIWLTSFSGSEVVWRDTRFRLEPDGRMKAVASDK
jgi:ceramide glucosyltransferase